MEHIEDKGLKSRIFYNYGYNADFLEIILSKSYYMQSLALEIEHYSKGRPK